MNQSPSQVIMAEESNTATSASPHSPCKSSQEESCTSNEAALSSRKSSSNSRSRTCKETPKESAKDSSKDSPAFSLRPRRSTPKPDLKSPSFSASSSTPSPKYSIFTKNPALLESRRFSPQSFEVVKRKLFRLIAKNEGIPCEEDEDFVPIDSTSLTSSASSMKNITAASSTDNNSLAVSRMRSENGSDQGESTSDSTASASLLAGYTKVKRHQQRTTVPLKPSDSIKSNIDLCIFSRKISLNQIASHFETSHSSSQSTEPAKPTCIYYDKHYITLKVVKILKPITVSRMLKVDTALNNSPDENITQGSNVQNSSNQPANGSDKSESAGASGSSEAANYTPVSVQCLIVLTQEVNLSSPLLHSSTSHSNDFDSCKQILPVYFYSEYSNIDLKPGQALEVTKFVAHEPRSDSLEENHLIQFIKHLDQPIADDDEDSESSNLTIICDDSADGACSSSPPSTRSKRKRRKVSHGSGSRTSCEDSTPNKSIQKQLSTIRIMVDEFWQSNQFTAECSSLVMDSKVITEPNESCKITDASFKLISFSQLDELEVKSSLLRQVKEYQQKSSFAPSVITLSDPRGDKYCNDRINKDHSQIHSRIPFISVKDRIVSVENPLLLKVNTIGKRKEVPSPGLRFTSKIIKDEVTDEK